MILQYSLDKQMLITFKGPELNEIQSMYSCGAARKYCYLDCYEIGMAPITVMDNYEFKVDRKDFTKRGNESMLIDVISYESKLNTMRNTPGCLESQTGDDNPDHIHQALHNWIGIMSNKDFDPFWVRNCEEEKAQPFDINNPRLQISVPYVKDRNAFNNGKVEIHTLHDRVIYKGNIINGDIDDELSIPTGGYI